MPEGRMEGPSPMKYFLTCVASTVAETATYPVDLTRTRLQIQKHQMGSVKYRGALQTVAGVVREEGFFSLWKGCSPAVLRHYVYSSRMMFYEFLRDDIFGKQPDGTFPLWKGIPCGMLAGAAGQFLASPMDLIKVRMQMDGRRQLEGSKPRYQGVGHAFRTILKEDGFFGLWRGVAPNCQRAALACLGDLTTYDRVKRLLLNKTSLRDNSVTHALSSFCAGFVSSVAATPADVVKSRMMNQAYKNRRGVLYSSSWDCLRKSVSEEGFWALYRGFFPTWMRLGPWSLLFWLTFEKIRVLAGVRTF